MANQKMNDELHLEQLEEVVGGRGTQRLSRSQTHQYLLPIDAEFGFKVEGKCGLHEVIDADGNCVPAPEL